MTKETADLRVEQFIRNVDTVIREKHLKREYVENCAGVSSGYLSRLRKGERVTGLSFQKALLIADAVDEDLKVLLYGDYEEKRIDKQIQDLENQIRILQEEKKNRARC